jgi:hypothetical protein
MVVMVYALVMVWVIEPPMARGSAGQPVRPLGADRIAANLAAHTNDGEGVPYP